jgi:hypothetical protein
MPFYWLHAIALSGASRISIFPCPFGSGRDVRWVDQRAKLLKMMSPPIVSIGDSGDIDRASGLRLGAPSLPVAIKSVHAVGHIDSRANERGSRYSVFFVKIQGSAHQHSITAKT